MQKVRRKLHFFLQRRIFSLILKYHFFAVSPNLTLYGCQ